MKNKYTFEEYVDHWKKERPEWIENRIAYFEQRIKYGKTPGISPDYPYRIKILKAALKAQKKTKRSRKK